jgi:hypothetical protein
VLTSPVLKTHRPLDSAGWSSVRRTKVVDEDRNHAHPHVAEIAALFPAPSAASTRGLEPDERETRDERQSVDLAGPRAHRMEAVAQSGSVRGG